MPTQTACGGRWQSVEARKQGDTGQDFDLPRRCGKNRHQGSEEAHQAGRRQSGTEDRQWRNFDCNHEGRHGDHHHSERHPVERRDPGGERSSIA